MANSRTSDKWFADLMAESSQMLKRLAETFSVTGMSEDDLVQETMLLAWERRETFERGTDFLTWIKSILRNFVQSSDSGDDREVLFDDMERAFAHQGMESKAFQEAHLALQDTGREIGKLSLAAQSLLLADILGNSYNDIARSLGEFPIP